MATYTVRGNSHNVVYTYRASDGRLKQHWESYTTELEAIQRKAYIDFLKKAKREDEILAAVAEYKETHVAVKSAVTPSSESETPAHSEQEDNTNRTYGEFMERFLPVYARKRRFSPNTYDSYTSNLKNHILPYFGNRVMSKITAEDIDEFLDHLSKKPCSGSKSYGKTRNETPRLSSATIKKCYNILTVGFPTAKKWHYINEIPAFSAPAEKTKKRKAWEPDKVLDFLKRSEDDLTLHLAVHMAFVCSLRAGEVAGIRIDEIDFRDRSMWISQNLQRVSDESLAELPKEEIVTVFPKKISSSSSSLILKGPKTEGSVRKQYLTTPLLQEIQKQLRVIDENKKLLGNEYHDYGLLFCHPDGTPLDPKSLDKSFKSRQTALGIKDKDQIEFQGLRKSGQMHKVRLTKNNYQLVAENSGQSPEVLMSNYNEALESEKRTLALLVETNFYNGSSQAPVAASAGSLQADRLIQQLQQDPTLSQQILQVLLSHALNAS